MERGFKSRCEEMARSLRVELGLGEYDPLPVDRLASHLDVLVWSIADLGLSEDDVAQLVEIDPDSWSAITVSTSSAEAIIYNPSHYQSRHSSDVMHELAHLLLGHQPSTVFFAGAEELALRGYNDSAEQEANWLAGALLLPRHALVQARRQQVSVQETCKTFGVSKSMLAFRMTATGVDRQFEHRNAPITRPR